MNVDECLRSIWAAIFSRKGGRSPTIQLWDDWDNDTRVTALETRQLEREELPVVLAKPRVGGPVLLTTRRLLCNSGEAFVSDIVGVKPVEFTERQKDQLSALDVQISAGMFLRITLEPGASYFALWSVLLHISKRNARSPNAR